METKTQKPRNNFPLPEPVITDVLYLSLKQAMNSLYSFKENLQSEINLVTTSEGYTLKSLLKDVNEDIALIRQAMNNRQHIIKKRFALNPSLAEEFFPLPEHLKTVCKEVMQEQKKRHPTANYKIEC